MTDLKIQMHQWNFLSKDYLTKNLLKILKILEMEGHDKNMMFLQIS